MSAPKRRPQHPQQHQQYYSHQGYSQDPTFAQYGVAPWQAQQQQQQMDYQQAQQFPVADAYGHGNNTQSAGSYPQHHQYQQSYPQYGYQNAFPEQNVYLFADYGQDASPHQLSAGSMSTAHSPKPSAGRTRLQNFASTNHDVGPHLESHVAQMSLGAGLPNKPVTDMAQSRSASGVQLNAATEGQERSDISLRYPALPALPPRPETPPSLRTGSDPPPDGNHSVRDYISALRGVIDTYEQRDEILRLRTEAVGFLPKAAYLAWKQPGSSDESARADGGPSNPVLGVRLLQHLDKLQKENEELGRLLSSGANANASSISGPGNKTQLEQLQQEVHESHQLIEVLDKALSGAEARATASERALEAACRGNSTAITQPGQAKNMAAAAETSRGAGQDGKKPAKAPATRGGGGGRGGGPKRSGSQPRAKKDEVKNETTGNVVAGAAAAAATAKMRTQSKSSAGGGGSVKTAKSDMSKSSTAPSPAPGAASKPAKAQASKSR